MFLLLHSSGSEPTQSLIDVMSTMDSFFKGKVAGS